MVEVFSAVVSAAGAVLVAVIGGIFARDRVKAQKEKELAEQEKERVERRAAERAEESRLSMEMIAANSAVTLVIAKKVLDMHTNGDVERALHHFDEVQEDYNQFLRKVVARQVAKV